MTTLDATKAGQMATAGVARPRVTAPAFGGGLGTYPCAWRLGVSTLSIQDTSVSFTAIANRNHKAWRPTEHSP
jgi:hypothetical protein